MSDHPPILFVHGMFMNSSSWSGWREFFAARGHATHAPQWPYRDGEPEALRAEPSKELPSLRLEDIVGLYRRAIAEMPEPPILIGHSMGGLVVQILLQEGGVRAGVAIDSVPPAGVSTAKWSFLRSNLPVILKRRRPFVPSKSWFRYAFAHTLDEAELERVWRTYAVPESGQVARDSTSDLAKIDPTADRPPLLMVAGELDHIIPVSLVRDNHAFYQGPPTEYREFAGRTHWICGQEGWQEVAQSVSAWLGSVVEPRAQRQVR